MANKSDKPRKDRVSFPRNPLFTEEFSRGDLKKIEQMSGMSYATVREVLIYQKRRNAKVVASAKTVLAFNRKFLSQFPETL